MPRELDIDLIFPIKDEISAWLMCLKAELLCEAGIIDTDEMNAILERAAEVIDRAPDNGAAQDRSNRRPDHRLQAGASPVSRTP